MKTITALSSLREIYEADTLRSRIIRNLDLSHRCLEGMDFTDSLFENVNLTGAYLGGSLFNDCIFRNCNLTAAELSNAHLSGAKFIDCDLDGALINYAASINADFSSAKNVPYIPMACPSTGAFIGYKYADGYIVKLEIPEDAKRSSATSRKCRCDKAKVIAIEKPLDPTNPDTPNTVHSNIDPNFMYTVGDTVYVDNFDKNRFKECAPGIHFFISREEALMYAGLRAIPSTRLFRSF